MKLRKITALVSAAALAAVSVSGLNVSAAENLLEKIKEEGKLQVITEPYFAPYEFCDTSKEGQEQYQGADMELARYMAEKWGVELEIIPLEFSAVLAGVATGKYPMAISGLGYTPERAESMELSESYRSTDAVHGFVVRKEDYDKYPDLESLAGKTIAYQNGSLQDMYTNEQIENPVTKPFDSVNNAILALQSGKCDAVAVYYSNGELFVEANEDLVMAEALFQDTEDTTVVACPKGETELIEEVNKILEEVAEEGLYEQWWDAATEQAKALGLDE
ncbi:MAG: transporter substrate-binding domain-containing protein [Candidatus Limivivens sp.]|nr:transporter substrate-binding domain-containing protein [Candidatus Limivivens sp.]